MAKSIGRFLCLVVLTAGSAACSHGSDLTRPSTQSRYGVEMARMNLWREAMFRFQRAVQISPQDAQAHNNLAVALEANGDFEGAAREYREALRLDRTNTYIQKNYSRYTEFMSRSKKRGKAAGAATPAAAPGSPDSAPVTNPEPQREPPVPPPASPGGSR